MPHFFLSYRRSDRDGQTLAHMVFRELRRRYGESSVFLDVDSRSPGLSFRAKVDQALNVTDAVLVIIGPEWLQRLSEKLEDSQDWVRYEVAESLKREGLPVVPVCCLGVKFPQQQELPDDLKELAWRDGVTVDPHQDFESHLARLLSDLERVLAASNEKKQLAKKLAEPRTSVPPTSVSTSPAVAPPPVAKPAIAKPAAISSPTPKAPVSKYYSLTPSYTVWTVVVSLAASGSWAYLLSDSYSHLTSALPFVQLNFVLTLLYGALCAAGAAFAAYKSRIWSEGAAVFVGLVTGILALDFSWATWIDRHLVASRDFHFLNLLTAEHWQAVWTRHSRIAILAVSPAQLWKSIYSVNAAGPWDIWSYKPVGAPLWLVWTVEAILIVGLPTYLCFDVIRGESRIFCTGCRTRCEWQHDVAKLRYSGNAEEIKRRFEARDWAYFTALGAPRRGWDTSLLIKLCRCPKCGGTNALFALVEGKPPKWAVSGLLLTRAESDAVTRIGKEIGGTA